MVSLKGLGCVDSVPAALRSVVLGLDQAPGAWRAAAAAELVPTAVRAAVEARVSLAWKEWTLPWSSAITAATWAGRGAGSACALMWGHRGGAA